MLTDQPPLDEAAPCGADEPVEPDLLPPDDADDLMAAFYREHVDDLPVPYPPADDPYLPPMPWQQEEIDSEHALPDATEIPAERILELNQQALAYYESCYPRSWAPTYLRGRLGADLTHPQTNGASFSVGYAPGSGRSLIRHLTDQGATLDELGQAGLVSQRESSDGTTYYRDFFRDRLVVPIRDPHDPTGEAILGFVGRRNPTKGDDDFAGPKYLNTRTTSVFTKGEALFGYAETRELLANGALPVIVEGPMDALAITLGSNGAALGIAPMGTALTVNQIKLLSGHMNLVDGRDRIAVATDYDPAGWKSAQKAFWHLTAADLDPTHLELPQGLDPAELFETQGADAIAAAIQNRVPLGDAMIDHLLGTAGHWSDPAVRQKIIEQSARILGARGSETWLPTFERLRNQLHLAPGILEHRTVTESIDRDRNRSAFTQARIDEINDQARARVAKRHLASRRRAPEQKLTTATATATVPTRPEHSTPSNRRDPAGPTR